MLGAWDRSRREVHALLRLADAEPTLLDASGPLGPHSYARLLSPVDRQVHP